MRLIGKGRFLKVTAVFEPRRLVWVNFERAKDLGFNVPPGNRMTESFEQELNEALSWRVLAPGEKPPPGSRVKSLHVDLYGGTGIGNNRGSGRAGFLRNWNANIRGFGVVAKNSKVKPEEDFPHSHGGASLATVMHVAAWGSVNDNLFTAGSTETLCIFAGDREYTIYPNGSFEQRGVDARIGRQVRPAHLLTHSDGGPFSLGVLLRAAANDGTLSRKRDPATGASLPDLKATFLNILDAHMRLAAEQRWRRVSHRAISTSNLELSAAQMDLETETSGPRTGLVTTGAPTDQFEIEHALRAAELERVYHALVKSLTPEQLRTLRPEPVLFEQSGDKLYRHHLDLEILKACGFKPSVVDTLLSHHPLAVRRLSRVVDRLASLQGAEATLEDGMSLVDVFGMLRRFPREYFANLQSGGAHASLAPLEEVVRALLAPRYSVNDAVRAAQTYKVDKGIAEFLKGYDEVMKATLKDLPKAYASSTSFARSVMARAEFENRPLQSLYFADFDRRIREGIAEFETTRNPAPLQRLIDASVADSLRNFDGLLAQGKARVRADGTLELQHREIQGVGYSVHAGKDGACSLELTVPLQGSAENGYQLEAGAGLAGLSLDDLSAVDYRYSLNGWKGPAAEVRGKVRTDVLGTAELTFSIPLGKGPDARQVQGLFHLPRRDTWVYDRGDNFQGYVFAVPDEDDLAALRTRFPGP